MKRYIFLLVLLFSFLCTDVVYAASLVGTKTMAININIDGDTYLATDTNQYIFPWQMSENPYMLKITIDSLSFDYEDNVYLIQYLPYPVSTNYLLINEYQYEPGVFYIPFDGVINRQNTYQFGLACKADNYALDFDYLISTDDLLPTPEPTTEPTTAPGTETPEPGTEPTSAPGTETPEPGTEPTSAPGTETPEPGTEPTSAPGTETPEPGTEPTSAPGTETPVPGTTPNPGNQPTPLPVPNAEITITSKTQYPPTEFKADSNKNQLHYTYDYIEYLNITLKQPNGDVYPDGSYFLDFIIDLEYKPTFWSPGNDKSVTTSYIYIPDVPSGLNVAVLDYQPGYAYSDNVMSKYGTLKLKLFGNVVVNDGYISSIPLNFVFSGECYSESALDITPDIRVNYFIVSPVEVNIDNIGGYSGEIEAIKDVVDTLDEHREEDKKMADDGVEQINGLVSQLQGLQTGPWKILWYPIEFTQSLLSVFQGTNSAVYSRAYNGITGYTYDESTGMLMPVRSRNRSTTVQGGTTLTFPSYTLPGLNVKLWDEYTFDMSTLKEDFPIVFDSLYVITTIIEVFWFVGFLRRKYDEVFKK